MLQTPSLINPPRNQLLSQPREIWRMKHPNINAFRSMFGDQRTKKRSARRIGRLASASKRIGQDGHFEFRIVTQSLVDGLNELVFRLANVQCREIDAPTGVANFVLQSHTSAFMPHSQSVAQRTFRAV